MSENIDGGSAETTDTSASSEVDAQLAEMHSSETAEPEVKEPAEETAEKPEVKKVVPLAALHEERRARQELQRQLQEISRQQAARDAIIEQRLAALTTAPKPTREEDPVGYLDDRIGQLTQQQQQILERDQQREQQAQQQRGLERISNHVIQTADAFKKDVPDFPEAVKHLNTTRTRELMALGASEQEAAHQAGRELDQAAIQWTVDGRNPAQTAYEFAKARGYQPKAAAQTPGEKIAAQQKGAAAAKSLGGGGAVSAGKLTAEALANMSDADFSKLSESDWRQAMGG